MLHLAKSRGHCWRPVLPQINADIGVEHIVGAHGARYRPLRRCGCGSLRFFGNMSAGSSASKSRTRAIPPAFSRNMISSPRRKISTSELLTLNFFGSLTAWLFPDLNTRAVAMVHLQRKYIHDCIYMCKSDSRALVPTKNSVLTELVEFRQPSLWFSATCSRPFSRCFLLLGKPFILARRCKLRFSTTFNEMKLRPR